MATEWERVGQRKRESIMSLLPTKWQLPEPLPSSRDLPNATEYPHLFLDQREIAITESYTAQQLVQHLAERTYSAVEVTNAFCHRATIAHQLVGLHEHT